MFVGLLLLGAIVGLLAAGIALIVGHTFWTAVLIYVGSALLCTIVLMISCALKHWAARPRQDPVVTLPEH